MDEKGFLIGLLNMTRRIFTREQLEEGKLPGACQDGNRSWITFLACIIAVYPPYSTHRLQPLGVSLFGPLSQAYIAATQGLVGISKREF